MSTRLDEDSAAAMGSLPPGGSLDPRPRRAYREMCRSRWSRRFRNFEAFETGWRIHKEDSMRKLAFWAVVLLPLLGLAGMADARPFSARLSGEEEVPPRETDARGAIQLKLNKEGTELEYRLRVSRIENVFGAHLHLGAVGVNGPIVVGLFEGPTGAGSVSGVLARGTI